MLKLMILCLVLAGCAHNPTKTVDLPTPVSCVDAKPEKPPLASDDDLRAMSDYQLTLSLWNERGMRTDYEKKLEVIVDGCVKAAR